jgi:pimeloyl-ACP methyl ester carboxylesterase
MSSTASSEREPMKTSAILGALLLAVSTAGFGAAAEPGRVRLPDGRGLYLSCMGRGAPTVLLEGGFGATSQAWTKVQPALAQHSRACAYDRAGYGLSDAGPLPRDGAAIAKDLDDGLRAARITGPFVVVGHSAGGLYMRIFADRRRREVVGMVLVETSVEYQDRQLSMFGPNAGSLASLEAATQRCLDLAEGRTSQPDKASATRCYAPASGGGPPGKLLPAGLWRAELSELETLWTATSDEVASGRASYGAMPLIVLTGADTYKVVPQPLRQAVDARWAELHRAVAQRSKRGVQREVEGSSHLMMNDRPDAVIQAVAEVIGQAAPRR